MGQFQFALWLAYWYLQTEVFEFEWDSANSGKSQTKHGVSTEEVESVRSGKVRPISCRAASRKERKLYDTVRKAIEGL